MDLETARFLTSPRGQRLLGEARATREMAAHRRVAVLRKGATAEDVRTVLQQDDLRRRAAARCPYADDLLFTAEALEQATAWPVALERAGRWPLELSEPLTDLGAGIGLDALAAASAGRPVVAWERDPTRALLLRHNAEALGVATRIRIREGDFRGAEAAGRLAFLDPARRAGGRRTRDPDLFSPPVSEWAGLLGAYHAAMVKTSPAAEAPPGLSERQEVVSLGGRARERRLFWGAGFADRPPRRALRLPGGEAIAGPGLAWPDPRGPQEGDWALDPDPAVTLAGLVGDLALKWDLRPIHSRIAYLLGSRREAAAPGRWVRVESVLPARPRAIDRWLEARGVGRLTIRTRGVADPAETWRRRLHPRGEAAATLIVTRDPSDRWVVLAGSEGGAG